MCLVIHPAKVRATVSAYEGHLVGGGCTKCLSSGLLHCEKCQLPPATLSPKLSRARASLSQHTQPTRGHLWTGSLGPPLLPPLWARGVGSGLLPRVRVRAEALGSWSAPHPWASPDPAGHHSPGAQPLASLRPPSLPERGLGARRGPRLLSGPPPCPGPVSCSLGLGLELGEPAGVLASS